MFLVAQQVIYSDLIRDHGSVCEQKSELNNQERLVIKNTVVIY